MHMRTYAFPPRGEHRGRAKNLSLDTVLALGACFDLILLGFHRFCLILQLAGAPGHGDPTLGWGGAAGPGPWDIYIYIYIYIYSTPSDTLQVCSSTLLRWRTLSSENVPDMAGNL